MSFLFLSIQCFAVSSPVQWHLFLPLVSVPCAPPTAVQPTIRSTASPVSSPPSFTLTHYFVVALRIFHGYPHTQQTPWPLSYCFLAPCQLFPQNKQPLHYRCCTRWTVLLFLLKSCRLHMSLSIDKCLVCHSRTVKAENLSRHLFVFYSTGNYDDCTKKQL